MPRPLPRPPLIGPSIVLFGMGCGFLWEVWEFLVDIFLGGSLFGPMQGSNSDTMTDKLFVLVASLFVAVTCSYLKRNGKVNVVDDKVRDSPSFAHEVTGPAPVPSPEPGRWRQPTRWPRHAVSGAPAAHDTTAAGLSAMLSSMPGQPRTVPCALDGGEK